MHTMTTVAIGASSSVLNSALEDELKAMDCDPFKILADLATSAEDESTRLGAAKELAKYLRPQLKSVDVRVAGQVQKTFAVIKFSEVDPAKAAELAKGLTPQKLLEQIAPNAAVIDHMRREAEKPPVAEDATVVVTQDAVVEVVDEMPDDYPGAKYMKGFPGQRQVR